MRKMTFKRRFMFAILRPVIKLLLYTFWATCRVKIIEGEDNVKTLLDKGEPIIPCYWHQMLIFGLWYMKKLSKKGLNIGFLISPSVDGEIPARIIQQWGMTAIRGSSTHTGAKALRDMYFTITKDKVSPATTPDGPTGPIHSFKLGTVTLAQLTQAPILPMACAASRYWQLKSWDQFIVPKPFSTIAIVIDKPVHVEKSSSHEQLEAMRLQLEDKLMHCTARAKQLVTRSV